MSPQAQKRINSFRSLRLTMRFIIPLIIAMTLLAYALLPLVDKLTLHWFTRDLDIRSQLITNTMQEPLGEFLAQGNTYRINSLMRRAIQDERIIRCLWQSSHGFPLKHCQNQSCSALYPNSTCQTGGKKLTENRSESQLALVLACDPKAT